MKGRDCIYLDQVKQDDLNNLTFMGDINGHLISQHRDEKDWFPYTLTFRRVLAYLDVYKRQVYILFGSLSIKLVNESVDSVSGITFKMSST